MGKSKAGHERLTAAERKQRAVELRKLGFSYQKIADQMGISVSGAHKMVTTALREINEKTAESAHELRRLELERLDEWLLRVAQEMKNGRTLPAIDRAIKIQNRRARLLGLDAPTKLVAEQFDASKPMEEMKQALEAGDESAVEYVERIARGEDVMTVCTEWENRLPRASEAEMAKMTREELMLAAQGKLTSQQLAEIRERAAGPPEVEEVRRRITDTLDRRARAREAAAATDTGSDAE